MYISGLKVQEFRQFSAFKKHHNTLTFDEFVWLSRTAPLLGAPLNIICTYRTEYVIFTYLPNIDPA